MTKFIVDTSVWIDFFNSRLPETLLDNLKAGLENEQVCLTDIILHELLIGCRNRKQYQQLKDLLSPLEVLRIKDDQLDAFNLFAWTVKQNGLLGKFTDISIAYLSHLHHYPILSLDTYFAKLAEKKLISTIEFV